MVLMPEQASAFVLILFLLVVEEIMIQLLHLRELIQFFYLIAWLILMLITYILLHERKLKFSTILYRDYEPPKK